MDGGKVLTLHPQGKKGRTIDSIKYALTRQAIMDCLGEGDKAQDELLRCAADRLEGRFEGSKGWYTESVKLDLEARRIIERYKAKPHDLYRLVR